MFQTGVLNLIELTCECVSGQEGSRYPSFLLKTGPITWIDIDIVNQYFVIHTLLPQNIHSTRWKSKEKTVAYILNLKKDPGIWTNLENVVLAYILQHLRLQKTNKNALHAPIPIILLLLSFSQAFKRTDIAKEGDDMNNIYHELARFKQSLIMLNKNVDQAALSCV